MTENQLVYLYCVTNEEPGLTEAENTADDLYVVCHKNYWAVSTQVKENDFGNEGLKKNMADLEWIKTHVMQHEKVIEQVMRNTMVIPFKFGTLFNNDDSLKTMLEEYDAEFHAILIRLNNREEWGVKIYCDVEKVKTASINDKPEILEIDNEIKSSPPGKAFFLKKKRAELLAQSANVKIAELSRENFKLLEDLSVETRINKLLPKEVTEKEDDMILNSAFLVNKDEVANFINRVDTLRLHCENNGFSVDCTGPWPPYNFCGLSRQKVLNA